MQGTSYSWQRLVIITARHIKVINLEFNRYVSGLYLPLLLKHAEVYKKPANEAWVQLAELLQIKAAHARV